MANAERDSEFRLTILDMLKKWYGDQESVKKIRKVESWKAARKLWNVAVG